MSGPPGLSPSAAGNGNGRRPYFSVGALQAGDVEWRPHDTTNFSVETSIVWLQPVDALDYVREELLFVLGASRGRPRCPVDGELIGYTMAGPGKRMPGFRRLFTLRDYDRGGPRPHVNWSEGCPSEAVDPSTVAPGVPGLQNARCRGGEA